MVILLSSPYIPTSLRTFISFCLQLACKAWFRRPAIVLTIAVLCSMLIRLFDSRELFQVARTPQREEHAWIDFLGFLGSYRRGLENESAELSTTV